MTKNKWEKKLKEVAALKDGNGCSVDAGICETVAALQLLGLHTEFSCQGHLTHAWPAPWVSLLIDNQLNPISPNMEKLIQLTSDFNRYEEMSLEQSIILDKQGKLYSQGLVLVLSPSTSERKRKNFLKESQLTMRLFTGFLKDELALPNEINTPFEEHLQQIRVCDEAYARRIEKSGRSGSEHDYE